MEGEKLQIYIYIYIKLINGCFISNKQQLNVLKNLLIGNRKNHH